MKKFFIIYFFLFSLSVQPQPLTDLSNAFNTLAQSLKTLSKNLENLSKPTAPIQTQEMITHERWQKLAQNKTPDLKKDFKTSTQSGINQNTKIPPKTNKIFRIMTYNVHHWKDPTNKYDSFDAIFNVIKTVDPDIIILQEVLPGKLFVNSKTNKKINELGFTDISACNTWNKNWFGNIIASKYKAQKIYRKKFDNQERPGQEDRCYAQMEVTLPNGKQLLIYGTHLEVGKNDVQNQPPASETIRQNQIQEIIDSIGQQNIPNTLIAADFNAVRKQDYQYDVLGKSVWDMLNEANRLRSGYFPTPTYTLDTLNIFGYVDSFSKLGWKGPRFTTWSGTVIDFIMLAPTWDLPLAGSYIYYDASSDHLPIIMDIDITK